MSHKTHRLDSSSTTLRALTCRAAIGSSAVYRRRNYRACTESLVYCRAARACWQCTALRVGTRPHPRARGAALPMCHTPSSAAVRGPVHRSRPGRPTHQSPHYILPPHQHTALYSIRPAVGHNTPASPRPSNSTTRPQPARRRDKSLSPANPPRQHRQHRRTSDVVAAPRAAGS